MTKTFLVTRPNHEPVTNYLHFYSQSLIDLAKTKKIIVTDLSGKTANFKEFKKQISQNIFSLILLNGHGSPHIITGWNDEPLITAPVSPYNFNSAIVYARSCQVGRYLGPYLIKKNVKAFVGYREDFIFVSANDSNPIKDSLAKLFLEPSNAIVKSLINGKTVEKANLRSKSMIRRHIRLVLKSRLKQRQQIAAFLWHDLNCQIVLGNDQSKVTSL